MPPTVAVLGAGNTLAGDDGVGVAVVEALRHRLVIAGAGWSRPANGRRPESAPVEDHRWHPGAEGAHEGRLAATRRSAAGGPEGSASPTVQLIEAGTAAFDAVALIDEGVTRLVVVDAVSGGGPPGAVYRFTLAAIEEIGDPHRASLHQVTLVEALWMAELAGRRFEEIVVIGVEPERTDWGAGLSPAVRARLPEVLRLVEREMARFADEPERGGQDSNAPSSGAA